MRSTLLLIDIQNDYFPGGLMELVNPEKAAAQAGVLIQAARDRHIPVIHVQHLSNRPGATFFIPGTPGAAIHTTVAPTAGEVVVTKHFPNSFRETNLHKILTDLQTDHLLICGMMTHMCIDTTVRAAADLGYQCTLAADACATKDLTWAGDTIPAVQVQGAYLAALSGLFAEVMMTDDIVNKYLSAIS